MIRKIITRKFLKLVRYLNILWNFYLLHMMSSIFISTFFIWWCIWIRFAFIYAVWLIVSDVWADIVLIWIKVALIIQCTEWICIIEAIDCVKVWKIAEFMMLIWCEGRIKGCILRILQIRRSKLWEWPVWQNWILMCCCSGLKLMSWN